MLQQFVAEYPHSQVMRALQEKMGQTCGGPCEVPSFPRAAKAGRGLTSAWRRLANRSRLTRSVVPHRIKTVSIGVALAVALGAAVLGCATAKLSDTELQSELEAMFETDQSHRMEMEDIGKKYGFNSPELRELALKQRSIDEVNIARLAEIIDIHGWPRGTVVREKASAGAFPVLQHAELSYQRKYLPLVRTATAAGETRPENLALLEDRISYE